MENLGELIQPYVTSIVVAVVGILTTIVLAFIATLKTKINLWIDTKTSASQRELIHKIANEAFAYIESTMKDQGSKTKLSAAYMYASEKLGQLGINVTKEEIDAAVEKAVLEYNAKQKKVS